MNKPSNLKNNNKNWLSYLKVGGGGIGILLKVTQVSGRESQRFLPRTPLPKSHIFKKASLTHKELVGEEARRPLTLCKKARTG